MTLFLAKSNMISQQIKTCNIRDKNLLNSLNKLDRNKFLSGNQQYTSYYDLQNPLPGGQTTLTPRIEALMLQSLNVTRNNKVLEIGTGCGYVTAVLSMLADYVYSIEYNQTNKDFAVANLIENGISNVNVICANGILGLAARAPFDKIFIGGALPYVPQELKNQLKIGGRLVAIIGTKPVLKVIIMDHPTTNEFIISNVTETDAEYFIGANINKFIF